VKAPFTPKAVQRPLTRLQRWLTLLMSGCSFRLSQSCALGSSAQRTVRHNNSSPHVPIPHPWVVVPLLVAMLL